MKAFKARLAEVFPDIDDGWYPENRSLNLIANLRPETGHIQDKESIKKKCANYATAFAKRNPQLSTAAHRKQARYRDPYYRTVDSLAALLASTGCSLAKAALDSVDSKPQEQGSLLLLRFAI
jgi:hypothetical protein